MQSIPLWWLVLDLIKTTMNHEVTEVYRDLCNLLETHGSEKVENILHDNPVSPIDGD